MSAREPLLKVDDLRVQFWTSRGTVYAVNGISFEIFPGETLGIEGESGCGKSVTALAILGILPRAGKTPTGTAVFEGRDLLHLSDRRLRGVGHPPSSAAEMGEWLRRVGDAALDEL